MSSSFFSINLYARAAFTSSQKFSNNLLNLSEVGLLPPPTTSWTSNEVYFIGGGGQIIPRKRESRKTSPGFLARAARSSSSWKYLASCFKASGESWLPPPSSTG